MSMQPDTIVRHKETNARGRIVRVDDAKGTAVVHWDHYIVRTPNVPLAELDPMTDPRGWTQVVS